MRLCLVGQQNVCTPLASHELKQDHVWRCGRKGIDIEVCWAGLEFSACVLHCRQAALPALTVASLGFVGRTGVHICVCWANMEIIALWDDTLLLLLEAGRL